MKRTILLTGRTGQVGSELLRLLPEIGEVVAPDRHELDLLNPDSIGARCARSGRSSSSMLRHSQPWTRQRRKKPQAHAINATAPGVLAEEAKKIGAAVVHYSTDYVFDGSKRTPYEEADTAVPINVYGKTKLAGEQAVQRYGCSSLNLSHSVGLLHPRPEFSSDDLTLGLRKGRVKSRSRPIWGPDLEPGGCRGDGEDPGSTHEPR